MKRGSAAEAIDERTGGQLLLYDALGRNATLKIMQNLQDVMMDHHKFTVEGYLAAVIAFEEAMFCQVSPRTRHPQSPCISLGDSIHRHCHCPILHTAIGTLLSRADAADPGSS